MLALRRDLLGGGGGACDLVAREAAGAARDMMKQGKEIDRESEGTDGFRAKNQASSSNSRRRTDAFIFCLRAW